MDTTFLEEFGAHYSAKLFSEGFLYKDKQITSNEIFGKFVSLLTIPSNHGDMIYIEEASTSENGNRTKSYEIHFQFVTAPDEIKTAKMLQYLDVIFNVNFKKMKAIHDNYIQAGLDIGLFVKNGDVTFKPSSLISHRDTSIINKKNKLIIDNVSYNPVVQKLIKTKKIVLRCQIPQSFDKGKLATTFQVSGLFFDTNPHFFYSNDEQYILVHSSFNEGTDVLTEGLLYTYFYDFFKHRIEKKFLNMDIDLKNISQELFNSYVDILDMAKI